MRMYALVRVIGIILLLSFSNLYAVNSSEYFPLEPDRSWTYLVDNSVIETETVLPGTVSIFGQGTTRIQSSDGSVEFYTNDGQGLRYYRLRDTVGDLLSFVPPVTILNPNPVVGDNIVTNGTARFVVGGIGSFSDIPSTFSSNVQVQETITVPAGTFETIRVDTNINIQGIQNGFQIILIGNISTWYAEGVGEVKSTGTVDGVTTSRELQSFTVPPEIISPNIGSVLTDNSLTVTWDNNNLVPDDWAVNIGSAQNGFDVATSGVLPSNTSQFTFNNLPVDGRALFVQLFQRVNGVYTRVDQHQITAFTGPQPGVPEIITPTIGTVLTDSSMMVTWGDNGFVPDDWAVNIGSAQNGFDVAFSGVLPSNSRQFSFTNLPVDGRALYVQLFQRVNGVYTRVDQHQITAFTGAQPGIPEISSPAIGTVLTDNIMTVTWNNNNLVPDDWAVNVGSNQNGFDVATSGVLPSNATQFTFTNLPVDGRALYVQLFQRINGVYTRVDQHQIEAFTGAQPGIPEITTPAIGTVLTDNTLTVTWNNNNLVPDDWAVNVGSNQNGFDVATSGVLPSNATQFTFTNLPVDGRALYVQLFQRVNGVYTRVDQHQITSVNTFIGTFSVSGSQTDSGCQDASDNGTLGFTGTFTVASQLGNTFVGTLDLLTLDIITLAGTGFVIDGPFTATVNQGTNASGDYTLNGQENGLLLAQNQGTFTGFLNGNTLSINYTGVDTIGDTCTSSGSFSGSR